MKIALVIATFISFIPLSASTTVFSVTKTADTADGSCDEDCSLREAIIAANDANGPDVVELRDLGGGPDVYRLTLPGPVEDGSLTGDLDIRDDLLIHGRGANEKIIQAGRTANSGIDRIFDVIGGVRGIAVRFESVVIENGAPTVLDPNGLALPPDPNDPDAVRLPNLLNTGGGVAARAANGRADVELVDCVVRSNRAIGANGGGIHVGSPAPVPLSPDPNADDPNAPIEIQQPSTLTVWGSMVASNVADLGGGGIDCGNCVLSLVGSTVSSNLALFTAEVGYGGGGIRATGVNRMEIEVSGVAGNAADGDGGGVLIGGPGAGKIMGSTLEDNDALGGGGGLAVERRLAGGEVAVERSALRGNIAAGDGGGVLAGSDGAVLLTRTTLERNAAGLTGGGLATDPLAFLPADPNDGASVELTLCRIAGNEALVGPQENGVASAVTPVLAEDCWWGCNLRPLPGPMTGCDGVTSLTVDADPQILLALDATPDLILAGHVSLLTADVGGNSAGAVIGASALEGVPVAFDGAPGSVAPLNGPVSGALARSAFTGTDVGTATVSATLDNATVMEEIEIVGDCALLGGDSEPDGVCDAGGPDPCRGGEILSCADNCPFVPNPGQADSGGSGAEPPDGIGNLCQCGDLDDSGIVDQADVRAFRVALADPSVPLPPGAARKCSVIGAADACGLLDVTVMRREIEGPNLLPGIAQVCAATLP